MTIDQEISAWRQDINNPEFTRDATIFAIGAHYGMRRAKEKYMRLTKRPVAFRYKNGIDAWVLTEDEAEANRALDTGHDAQGLYVLDGTPLAAEWQPIETAPTGENDFYLVCCNDPRDDRSPFVVRGSIFASARKHPPQHHLSMAYLTHWMPLPAKPEPR